MLEQLFNPWTGGPETQLERLIREHTEKWAPTVVAEMESATTWTEVKAIYELHNKQVKELYID
jgi:hypothetical protein